MTQLLGGRTPTAFLAKFWQKEALLVRDALPGFEGIVTPKELMKLAERDDMESRIVVRERGRWSFAQGPFRKSDLARMPSRNWTLLVQGVNAALAAGDALLRRFAFIPFSRLDDLMISYAAPGGGVGPHFDSYDVFLLQGTGRRRWRYGRQRDLSLVPDLPLKILRRFAARRHAILGPGDMLYLPPHYAHDGVAVDACTTYSIGFRAPSYQELVEAFLDYLRDRTSIEGRYADPDLKATRHPAKIDAGMRRRVAAVLASIRWDRDQVQRFLGSMLTEPESSIVFTRPPAPLHRRAFAARIARRGLALDRATQLLYDERALYINGAAVAVEASAVPALRKLADERALSGRDCARLGRSAVDLLHQWYRYGFVAPSSA